MNRIDAHQHFWQFNTDDYGWIDDSMAVLRRDFFPEHLRECLSVAGFEGSIAVQARQCLEETEWLLQLAGQNSFLRGVVGWVDLRSEQVGAQLDRYTTHPKFVGVRHVVQDEPDPEFLLRPEFLRGIREVEARNLSYDLLIFPVQLPAAIKFARMFPHTRLIVDHIAKPYIRTGVLEPWASEIRQLAACENVWCKVSGMVTEADFTAWKPEDFTVYLDTVFDAFGCGRILIGSDWPVCTVAGPYAAVMSLVTEYIQKFSPSEQAQVLGGNAFTAYRIPL